MNRQQILMPVSLVILAAAIGNTWYQSSSSESGSAVSARTADTSGMQMTVTRQDASNQHRASGNDASVISANGRDSETQPTTKQRNQAAATQQNANTETDSEAPPFLSPIDHQTIADEEAEKLISGLNDEFYQQDTDEHWSVQSSNQIYSYFDQMAQTESKGTSELRSVECRTSLCKVEVLHENAAAAEDFFLRFPSTVNNSLPSISYQFENLPDGRVDVVMYLATDTTSDR